MKKKSNLQDLLGEDDSVSMHHRTLTILAVELHKETE